MSQSLWEVAGCLKPSMKWTAPYCLLYRIISLSVPTCMYPPSAFAFSIFPGARLDCKPNVCFAARSAHLGLSLTNTVVNAASTFSAAKYVWVHISADAVMNDGCLAWAMEGTVCDRKK